MSFQQNALGVFYFPNANARCVVHNISVGTSPVQVLAPAVRGSAFFHNPGTVPICVYQALNANGHPQSLAFGDPGTFFIDAAQTGAGATALEMTPCGAGAWMAIASAAGGSLTATEF